MCIRDRSYAFGGGNATRGILAGGNPGSSLINNIDFLTISTTGNTQDFGDLTAATSNVVSGAVSDPTRMVCMGGQAPSYVNTIQFFQIATTGNAKDFGDIQSQRDRGAGMSTGHGGL